MEQAIEHTSEFDRLSLVQVMPPMNEAARTVPSYNSPAPEALSLEDVLSRYFAEIDRTGALAAKTRGEKQDALALMAELTGNKPPAHMTKVDAQEVKAALFKLPKNRSKNPNTRDLPLSEALEFARRSTHRSPHHERLPRPHAAFLRMGSEQRLCRMTCHGIFPPPSIRSPAQLEDGQ